jgi:2-polyprenyl-6-methoxyphenol hydroxylase-like FAD-dependent oxidoreductase
VKKYFLVSVYAALQLIMVFMKNTKNFDCEVAIVGGSLAGSSLAFALGEMGHTVALFEAAQMPRKKSCGEGLSQRAVDELNMLGLTEAFHALPKLPFFGFEFIGDKPSKFDKRSGEEKLPVGFGIERALLDMSIFSKAAAQGSVLAHKACRVLQVDRLGLCEGFQLHTEVGGFSSRFLVLADGANSKIADALGLSESRISAEFRHGFTCHLSGTKAKDFPKVQIALHGHRQMLLTPLPEGKTNLTILFDPQKKETKDRPIRDKPDAHIDDALDIFELNGEIERSSILGVSQIGRFRRPAYSKGIFCIGDSYQQLDPLGGMGMTQALASARITAGTLHELLHLAPNAERTISRHKKRIALSALPLRGFTALSTFALQDKPFQKWLRASPLSDNLQKAFCEGKKSARFGFHTTQLLLLLLGLP